MDRLFAIKFVCLCGLVQHARIGAKTKGAADIFNAILFRHQMDNRMCCLRVEFVTVRSVESYYISCKFHDRKLHTETETEEWNLVLAGIFDRKDLTVNTTVTETTRYENTADVSQKLIYILFIDILGRNPFNVDIALVGKTAVL